MRSPVGGASADRSRGCAVLAMNKTTISQTQSQNIEPTRSAVAGEGESETWPVVGRSVPGSASFPIVIRSVVSACLPSLAAEPISIVTFPPRWQDDGDELDRWRNGAQR